MALFVIPVPQPAAGHDWLYTVPGQYIEHITAITATLTTQGAAPTTMVDSSGNVNDGIYHNGTGGNPLGAGAFSGANAALWQWPGSNVDNRYGEIDSGVDCGIGYSFDCWIKPGTSAALSTLFSSNFASAGTDVFLRVDADGTIFYEYNGPPFYSAYVAAGTFPMDGNFHHVGITDNHVAAVIYLDGVAQTMTYGGTPTSIPGFAFVYAVGINQAGTALIDRGYYGQPAFYQSILAAGRFAAHHAAGTSLAAYNTAVLADSPINYYELADSAGGTGRQVVLDVTNGTRTVLEVPTGFADLTTAGPYAYSWQPNLNSSTQVPSGLVTTIAMPDLILPAGYTLGTRTLDLGAADQWSAINIWWDDSFMQALNAIPDYVYPPGVRLVYQRVGA